MKSALALLKSLTSKMGVAVEILFLGAVVPEICMGSFLTPHMVLRVCELGIRHRAPRVKSFRNLLHEFINLSIYSDDLIIFSNCTLSVILGSLTWTMGWDLICVIQRRAA
jgi:hypothetical protein